MWEQLARLRSRCVMANNGPVPNSGLLRFAHGCYGYPKLPKMAIVQLWSGILGQRYGCERYISKEPNEVLSPRILHLAIWKLCHKYDRYRAERMLSKTLHLSLCLSIVKDMGLYHNNSKCHTLLGNLGTLKYSQAKPSIRLQKIP